MVRVTSCLVKKQVWIKVLLTQNFWLLKNDKQFKRQQCVQPASKNVNALFVCLNSVVTMKLVSHCEPHILIHEEKMRVLGGKKNICIYFNTISVQAVLFLLLAEHLQVLRLSFIWLRKDSHQQHSNITLPHSEKSNFHCRESSFLRYSGHQIHKKFCEGKEKSHGRQEGLYQ